MIEEMIIDDTLQIKLFRFSNESKIFKLFEIFFFIQNIVIMIHF